MVSEIVCSLLFNFDNLNPSFDYWIMLDFCFFNVKDVKAIYADENLMLKSISSYESPSTTRASRTFPFVNIVTVRQLRVGVSLPLT